MSLNRNAHKTQLCVDHLPKIRPRASREPDIAFSPNATVRYLLIDSTGFVQHNHHFEIKMDGSQ